MRYFIACAIVILVTCGIAFTQDDSSQTTARTSLAELLAAEQALAYRHDSSTATYEIQLLTDDMFRQSQTYYANREENKLKYQELRHQQIELQIELRRKLRTPRAISESPEMARLQKEIDGVSRPTGMLRVAKVTQRGSDFIGLKELGTSREVLIPLHRIESVIARPSE